MMILRWGGAFFIVGGVGMFVLALWSSAMASDVKYYRQAKAYLEQGNAFEAGKSLAEVCKSGTKWQTDPRYSVLAEQVCAAMNDQAGVTFNHQQTNRAVMAGVK